MYFFIYLFLALLLSEFTSGLERPSEKDIYRVFRFCGHNHLLSFVFVSFAFLPSFLCSVNGIFSTLVY